MADGRKVYDLEVVPDALERSGGLLLFKGTESLMLASSTAAAAGADAAAEAGHDGGDGGTDKSPAPWSALGLSLTDTSRLLFRTCAAGEGLRASSTFAVLGNRALPFGEWVHVACDISRVRIV